MRLERSGGIAVRAQAGVLALSGNAQLVCGYNSEHEQIRDLLVLSSVHPLHQWDEMGATTAWAVREESTGRLTLAVDSVCCVDMGDGSRAAQLGNQLSPNKERFKQ